jgi:hypothetical protein
MKNNFEKWNFIDDSENFYIDTIVNNSEGLHITICRDNISYKVIFESYFSYRISDESILFRIIENNSEIMDDNIFYIVENSSYIDFLKETGAFYDEVEMIHYAIYTENECVDIVVDIGNIPKFIKV